MRRPAGTVRDRGRVHRARRCLLLRVDGHRPGSRARLRPGTHRAIDDDGHRFVVEVGSAEGARVLATIGHAAPPRDAEVDEATPTVTDAAGSGWAGRCPPGDIRTLLRDSVESPHWQDVADRCLTCGNCTMVCPTCFCTTTEDVTDLTGEHVERSQRWASCFETRLLLHPRRQRPVSRARAGTGSGSRTSSAPGTTSSTAPAASAAAGASRGARSASTSRPRSPNWPRERDGHDHG